MTIKLGNLHKPLEKSSKRPIDQLNRNTSITESSFANECINQNTFASCWTQFTGVFQYVGDTILIVSCQVTAQSSVTFGYHVVISELYNNLFRKKE